MYDDVETERTPGRSPVEKCTYPDWRSLERWAKRVKTALCYWSQTSKFLRKHQRNRKRHLGRSEARSLRC
ncbi:hypothetical protein [Funiculus sociatus]|uniref:hypothetical protein n=1 Tax=Funiculus sociatus TaxID=450527 RepID=UPI003298AC71